MTSAGNKPERLPPHTARLRGSLRSPQAINLDVELTFTMRTDDTDPGAAAAVNSKIEILQKAEIRRIQAFDHLRVDVRKIPKLCHDTRQQNDHRIRFIR